MGTLDGPRLGHDKYSTSLRKSVRCLSYVLLQIQMPFQIALELAMQLMRRKVFSATADKIGIRLFGINKIEGGDCDEKVRKSLYENVQKEHHY